MDELRKIIKLNTFKDEGPNHKQLAILTYS